MSLELIFALVNQFPYRDTSQSHIIPLDKIQHRTHRFPLHAGRRISPLFFRYKTLLRGGFHRAAIILREVKHYFPRLPVAHLPV